MKNLLILMRHRKVYFQSPETSAGTELFSDYMKFCNSFFNSLNDDIIKKIVLRFPYKNLKKDSLTFFQILINLISIAKIVLKQHAINQSYNQYS